MTNDLRDRLEAAAPTLDRAIFDPPTRAARVPRRTRPLLVAAALLVTLAGGVVALAATIDRRSAEPAPSRVATVPPDGDSPGDGPSGSTLPSAPAFDVPRPEQLAVLDEALGAGAPSLHDPKIAWLYPDETIAIFVRFDDGGSPVAALQVADWAAPEWDKSFNDGEAIDLDGVPARMMADAARPTVGWQVDRGVRTVVGTGAIEAAEVITAATAFAAVTDDADLVAPAGYVAQSLPASSWTVMYPDGVNVAIRTAALGEHLDASTRAFVEYGNASPQGDGSAWLAELVWDGRVQSRAGYIDLDERTQVSVHIPVEGTFDGRFDVNSALASIRLVDGDSVPVRHRYSRSPEMVLVNGGESVNGRWVLSEWQMDDGTQCIELEVADGLTPSGCDNWLGPCGFDESLYMERLWRWSVLVPGAPSSVVLVSDGRSMPADARWQAGDYTVATGSQPFSGRPTEWQGATTVEVLVYGVSCTELPGG